MRFLFLLYFSFIFSPLSGVDYKDVITSLEDDLAHAEECQKGDLLVRMAIAHYRDQAHERAFKTFLEALSAPGVINGTITSTPLSEKDQAVYEEALAVYLNSSCGSAVETAHLIREKFTPALEKNPENYGLGFLLAAAYANLHLFEEFFSTYYKAYQSNPNHFLAYKTKAIVYVKLFEMSKTSSERLLMSQLIQEEIEKALSLNPSDSSLYKFIVQFAPAEKNALKEILSKIIENRITISRSDIPFYVQKALDLKEFELAQQFICAMRTHYPYSRVLIRTQQQLDELRGAVWKYE